MNPGDPNNQKLVFFVTDLHGKTARYEALERAILNDKPAILLMGGDLLPHAYSGDSFITTILVPMFERLRNTMGAAYPAVMLILGNDDPRTEEETIMAWDQAGLWIYLHMREVYLYGYHFYGYSFVPPTPFRLKDWDKYDVSCNDDPGCIPPVQGIRTVVPDYNPGCDTIKTDLLRWLVPKDLTKAVILFHTPPYNTRLDRAALDNQMIDSVPLDPCVGSVAVRDFIFEKQPFITLHGHIHESTRLTGIWKESIGKTISIQGAGEGSFLTLVKFPLERPEQAVRIEIIS